MKSIVKKVAWSLSRHEPSGEADICIAATRRGGSTMVMEIIAAGGPVRYIDQPLSIHSASRRHRRLIPVPRGGQFVSVSEADYAQIRNFLTRLHTGDLVVNAAWQMNQATWHARTSRVVFKIVDAKSLIPRLSEDLGFQVLWFIRHPIPTALSIIRNGWGHTVNAFPSDVEYVDRFLGKDVAAYCRDVLQSGDRIAIEIMNWALENRPMYDEIHERPDWRVLPFEVLVSDRKRCVDGLSNWLGLPDREAMLKQAGTASRSSRKLSTRVDPSAHSLSQIRSWRTSLDESRIRDLMEIPGKLGIPIYNAGDDLPDLDTLADRIPGFSDRSSK